MPLQTAFVGRMPTMVRLFVVGALAVAQTACAGIDRPASLNEAAQIEPAQGIRLYAPATTLTVGPFVGPLNWPLPLTCQL